MKKRPFSAQDIDALLRAERAITVKLQIMGEDMDDAQRRYKEIFPYDNRHWTEVRARARLVRKEAALLERRIERGWKRWLERRA